MAFRSFSAGARGARQISRHFSTATEQTSTKGPKLPPGNDPSAYHSQADAVSTS